MDVETAHRCAVLLEPGNSADDFYTGMRRFLLVKKAMEGRLDRHVWKCNGIGYSPYRDFIRQYNQWSTSNPESPISFIGESEKCPPSPSFFSPSRFQSRSNNNNSSSTGEFSSDLNKSPSMDSEKMNIDGQVPSLENKKNFSFSGIKAIWGDYKYSANVVRFSKLNPNLLGVAHCDGALRIFCVASKPPLLHELKGHTKEITDFNWSSNDGFLCSSSLDQTLRVWNGENGECMRIIYNVSSFSSVLFHPINNNFLIAANSSQEIELINFSTGKILHKMHLENNITAINMESSGKILFAGDSMGCVYSIGMDLLTGSLTLSHRVYHGSKKQASIITSLQIKTFSLMSHSPLLLTVSKDGSLCLFSAAFEVGGYLSLKFSLQLSPRAHSVRASFCPMLSLDQTEYIVAGSDDHNIYFYDLSRSKHPCINKLQGHGAPVVDVCWNHAGNLMASCDCDGIIIIWKYNTTQ